MADQDLIGPFCSDIAGSVFRCSPRALSETWRFPSFAQCALEDGL